MENAPELRMPLWEADMYLLLKGKSPWAMTLEEKAETIKTRAEYLKKREWDRWIPGGGVVMNLAEICNQDSQIWVNMHSTKYVLSNIVYNCLILLPLSYAITEGINKLVH